MTIDITPEAVEWLAQADDAYEIGRVQSLRFAPTLRALSSENTTIRAERDSAIMANKADGKIVVDMAGAMDKITPDFMATMAPLFAGPIIEMLEKEQEAVIAERDAALAALTASQAETAAAYEAVKVKPLVWVEDIDRDSDTFGSLLSNPMIGRYYRIDRGIGGPCRGSWSLQRYDTLDAAKAAAQADYATRILSAIATPSDSKAALDQMIADAEERGMRKAAGVVNQHSEIGRTSLAKTEDVGHRMMWTAIIQRSDFIRDRILAAIPKGTDHE